MKQTVEEAAVDFADYELKNLDKLPFVVSAKADSHKSGNHVGI